MALINTLNGIGDAIREKTGGTELIPLKEMADAILSISGGESVGYSSITYNEDGTVTLTQTNGAIRTMACEYDGNKLVGLKYGKEVIPLTYEDDVLVGIGGMEVDVSKAPVTSGGAELNIAYGYTEPTDTSKLWIKANEPESIVFGKDFEGVESIETVGNIPTAGYGIGCVRVGNKVYLFGGYINKATNTINVFDIETKTITTLETILPIACWGMGCANVGNKVYLFGGQSGGSSGYYKTINVFDTETETITTLSATLPGNRCYTSCVPIGNKIYLLGGQTGAGSYTNTILVFDTETEATTTLGVTLPQSRAEAGCVSIGTKIYLFGGKNYVTGNGYPCYNTIFVFDTETQEITTLETILPIACTTIGCTSIGTKVYLFGGYDGNGYHNTINVFDTETQTLTTLETVLPVVCSDMGCISIGTKVYLFGGRNSGRFATINQFSLTHNLSQNNIEVITDYKNFFNVVNTDTMKVEIGVDSVLIGNENNQAEVCEAYLYQNDAWVQI